MTRTLHKKLAIIETGGSHDEVLKPQLLFLGDESVDVHLIIRREHYNRTRPYEGISGLLLLGEDVKSSDRIRHLRAILKYLSGHGIKNVIVNTAQGAFIRDLTLFAPRRLRFTGIAHNPQKLGRSFTQKLISRRIKKYFVLSDYILETVKEENPDLQPGVFYPVFFPPHSPSGNHDTLDVCIPGAVDLNRRDYNSLLNEMAREAPDSNIRFIFLGRCMRDDARAFRKNIEQIVHSSQIVFYDSFIPEDEFISTVANADLIMPLLTPGVPLFELYSKYKVTGAVNLAFGLRIPMLMHEALAHIEDFGKTAFFYQGNDLVENLNHLNRQRHTIVKKQKEMAKIQKFKFDFQKERYLGFLNL